MVNDARPGIKELTVAEARERLEANPDAVFVDVREDREWDNGHAIEAIHLGKGILERDLEKTVPSKDTEIIMYCGGGYRSILTAKAAAEMGYTNASSLAGGYKALVSENWPMKKENA